MYLDLAQKYLLKARSTSGGTQRYFANLCQVCLAKEGSRPEKIGTTRQELVKLQNKKEQPQLFKTARNRRPRHVDHAAKCKKYLQQCRQAQGASRQYYANLCLTTLAKLDIKASEIGSSDEELEDLQKKGFLESASNYLTQARNASGIKQKCYADLCWEYLAKAKATPKDIGTSEDELQKMNL